MLEHLLASPVSGLPQPDHQGPAQATVRFLAPTLALVPTLWLVAFGLE
jgi:hypothetical protein